MGDGKTTQGLTSLQTIYMSILFISVNTDNFDLLWKKQRLIQRKYFGIIIFVIRRINNRYCLTLFSYQDTDNKLFPSKGFPGQCLTFLYVYIHSLEKKIQTIEGLKLHIIYKGKLHLTFAICLTVRTISYTKLAFITNIYTFISIIRALLKPL